MTSSRRTEDDASCTLRLSVGLLPLYRLAIGMLCFAHTLTLSARDANEQEGWPGGGTDVYTKRERGRQDG